MDELTAKKIENAKMVLEDGDCFRSNCNECFANINGCSVLIDSPEGRKFFEDKLKEYELMKKIPEFPAFDDICCPICESVSLKTDGITEQVKTISKRIITFHICPSCGTIIKAEVE